MMLTEDDEKFIRLVVLFWQDKEDPTCYAGWDETRCAQLMPDFYNTWLKYEQYKKALNITAQHERYRVGY